MATGFTINKLLAARHVLMPFEGEWRATFGTPSDRGVWLLYGKSGCGKTSFLLKLMKMLRTMGKQVVYWSIEQATDYGFQQAVARTQFDDITGLRFYGPKHTFEEHILPLMTRKKKPFRVLIIDSLTPLHEMVSNPKQYVKMICTTLDNCLVIFVSHEEDGRPNLAEGRYLLTQANIKIHVSGYKAHVNNRAGFSDTEGGGEPFVIWDEGAQMAELSF